MTELLPHLVAPPPTLNPRQKCSAGTANLSIGRFFLWHGTNRMSIVCLPAPTGQGSAEFIIPGRDSQTTIDLSCDFVRRDGDGGYA